MVILCSGPASMLGSSMPYTTDHERFMHVEESLSS